MSICDRECWWFISAGGNGAPEAGKGSHSWAKVVQGTSRQPLWTSHRIWEGEIEELQHYITKVLELSETMMEDCR